LEQLRRSLTDPRFTAAAQRYDAVNTRCTGKKLVLWDGEHRFLADASRLSACVIGHGFGQSEEWLVSKDALASMLHLRVGRAAWWSASYRICGERNVTGSLRCELAAFVGHFLALSAQGESPLWIIKPATLSRSRGLTVCDRLEALLAACETHVRAGTVCVAQRYVSKPLLYQGRKFDLRLLVGVRSLQPLELVAYDHVVVRCAAVPYDATSLDTRVHLTVTQYLTPGAPLLDTSVWAAEMAAAGVDVYGAAGLVRRCHNALVELFAAAVCSSNNIGRAGESLGVVPHPHVAALYGADIIVDSSNPDHLQPIILEIKCATDALCRDMESSHYWRRAVTNQT
jgi:tubulin--tyrosine ligase-like protein 12